LRVGSGRGGHPHGHVPVRSRCGGRGHRTGCAFGVGGGCLAHGVPAVGTGVVPGLVGLSCFPCLRCPVQFVVGAGEVGAPRVPRVVGVMPRRCVVDGPAGSGHQAELERIAPSPSRRACGRARPAGRGRGEPRRYPRRGGPHARPGGCAGRVCSSRWYGRVSGTHTVRSSARLRLVFGLGGVGCGAREHQQAKAGSEEKVRPPGR
jgi:hypothetical protein